MNGIQGIRNINAAAASKADNGERYQAQYHGDSWRIFDSHTGGWGQSSFDTARDAQQAADALNV